MRTLVVSHRTNAGNAPENTLAGIEAAIRDGAHAIEVDVRATGDGELVLLHDETLARTAGDPRAIADLTLAELREVCLHDPHGLVARQRVPTLVEALDAIDGHCAIEIDLPMRGLELAIVEVVRARGAGRWTWFTAHPPEDAALLREHCPGATVLLSVAPQPLAIEALDPRLRGRMPRDLPDAIRIASSLGLHGINSFHGALSATLVTHAHARGLQVGCWTVNEEHELRRAGALGVDAVTTDDPRLAHRVLRSL